MFTGNSSRKKNAPAWKGSSVGSWELLPSSAFCPIWTPSLLDSDTHVQGMSSYLVHWLTHSHSSLETPSQTHPICFAHFLGIPPPSKVTNKINHPGYSAVVREKSVQCVFYAITCKRKEAHMSLNVRVETWLEGNTIKWVENWRMVQLSIAIRQAMHNLVTKSCGELFPGQPAQL
jgi:hypothetical protein